MNQNKVWFETLGCDKNTVDSQVMQAVLTAAGFIPAESPEEADTIIVNTCCFIDDAKTESIDAIFELLPHRIEGECSKFIVAGCMAQRYAVQLAEEIPEVDAFVGVNNLEDIVSLIRSSDSAGTKIRTDEAQPIYCESAAGRETAPDSVTAYLKIAEGCDKHCTYCAIPGIRGHYRSREPEAILAEAKSLKARGIEECILIAQDLTCYGNDLENKTTLAELLDRLATEVPFTWIRLLYLYPEGIDAALLQVMSKHSNICHYLDIPIQHTEKNILKRMGRRIDKKAICDIVNSIKTHLPDAVLRTTVITGFPGETEAEFEAMLDTLAKLRFDRLGAFTYSQEEGTPAALLPDQIDEAVKEERRDRIYAQQQAISLEKNQSKVGTVQKVLIEGCEEGIYFGRTAGDAPDIDCGVIIEDAVDLIFGQFYDVEIYQAIDYDLIGGLS